ncbi:hypothetical protein OSB04_un000719 [Centaurea solstitialis]|uniref:DUF241 domain protein n=1 Tax=Centaurea solstitialis TaxID=347529 RepID=A0AA38S5P4_9ASTR|nr:hypothetical protein OSB04_un000719 [Centaurea solstitialis]
MDCSTSTSSSSSPSISKCNFRSISLPTRSHPSTYQLEEELTNLKTWEASSTSSMPTIDTVCGALMGLERLYTCVNDLVGLPLTQQSLSHQKHQKLVDELLDRSMMLLDVCGSLRDTMEQVKQHVRDVQSALRRGKGDLSFNTSFFKKIEKDVKRSLSTLKQINNKIGATTLSNLDHHLSGVIMSLRDTSLVSISVFKSLLALTSSVFISKSKPNRWSIVSSLRHKGATESVDHPRLSYEDLESHIEVIENGMECLFRSLIQTRASLLNACSV